MFHLCELPQKCAINVNGVAFQMEAKLRRIPLSRRSHVIGSQSLDTGVAEHESALERDFVTLASFADPGAVVTAQPVTIRFRQGEQSRRYTPDFRVDWSTGSTDFVEVKYRADLRASWSNLRPAFAAARRWAQEHGARFRIATDCGIRSARLEAAKRLLPLRNAPVDPALAELAVAKARTEKMDFIGLVDALPASREVALGVVWRLIARGALSVDLTAPILPGSSVRAA